MAPVTRITLVIFPLKTDIWKHCSDVRQGHVACCILEGEPGSKSLSRATAIFSAFVLGVSTLLSSAVFAGNPCNSSGASSGSVPSVIAAVSQASASSGGAGAAPTDADIIREGRQHNVTMQLQGNTPYCGIYALNAVLQYYSDTYLTPNAHPAPQGTGSIHEVAKNDKNINPEDGLYTTELTDLARKLGVDANWQQGSLAAIKQALDDGYPPIVMIDVGNDGKPTVNGLGGHWAVVEGMYTGKDGIDYLVVKHGWSTNSYVWKASDFLKSWQSMVAKVDKDAKGNTTRIYRNPMVVVKPTRSQRISGWFNRRGRDLAKAMETMGEVYASNPGIYPMMVPF